MPVLSAGLASLMGLTVPLADISNWRLADWGLVAIYVVLLLALVTGWALTDEPSETFLRYHAGAASRAMDSLYWTIRHGIDAFDSTRSRRSPAFGRGALAFAIGLFVLAVPVLSVVLPGLPGLSSHGYAFASGALLWTILVESAAQPDRNARYDAAAAPDAKKMVRSIAVLVSVEALMFGVVHLWHSGTGWAFLMGASVTGVADFCGVLVTFGMGPFGAMVFRRT